MDIGLLILRLTVGLTFAAHGTEKLFGWFGGPGSDGTVSGSQCSGCYRVAATR
jgi:putative oxidoreductase